NGFVNARFIDLENLFIFNRSVITDDLSKKIPANNIFCQLNETIKEVDIVILAVKPQDFENLTKKLKQFITPNHIILSVMAGVSIKKIKDYLPTNKVIRSMPKLPSQIGLGTTVFTVSMSIVRKSLIICRHLINSNVNSIWYYWKN